MRLLVTRPRHAALRTEERLKTLGHTALIDPLLTLHFTPPDGLCGEGEKPDAVVMTSANGARAVAGHPDLPRLVPLPLWTVGMRTTEAAREIGFTTLKAEALDLAALADMLNRQAPMTLLQFAAEIRAGDLGTLAPKHTVLTRTVYSAVPAGGLSPETVAALGAGELDAVLHYSRRLAETYIALARAAGVEGPALAVRQICLSDHVGAPLREAGAMSVSVAKAPREDDLLALIG